jgi:outer membrane phospholipase A
MGYGYGALKNNIGDSLYDYETTVKRIKEGITMRKAFLEEKKMLGH